jgi:predicted adenylyl cyclase CyaB
MITEIEAKFPLDAANVDSSVETLESLGFKSTKVLYEKDTYYVHTVKPEVNPLGKTYLRVRTKNEVSSTAMHYQVQGQVDYEWVELETKVADGDKLRAIYNNLFEIASEVSKAPRNVFTSDSYPDYEIVLDYIENLGYFIEVEAPSLDQLWELSSKLGLTKELADTIKGKAYPDLLKEKLQNQDT